MLIQSKVTRRHSALTACGFPSLSKCRVKSSSTCFHSEIFINLLFFFSLNIRWTWILLLFHLLVPWRRNAFDNDTNIETFAIQFLAEKHAQTNDLQRSMFWSDLVMPSPPIDNHKKNNNQAPFGFITAYRFFALQDHGVMFPSQNSNALPLCAESALNNQIHLYAEKSVFFRVHFSDFDKCPKTYPPKTPPEFNWGCRTKCLVTGQQNGRSAMDLAAQITKAKKYHQKQDLIENLLHKRQCRTNISWH